jgi:CubicO group peptidase (beta-lactamase class C family)
MSLTRTAGSGLRPTRAPQAFGPPPVRDDVHVGVPCRSAPGVRDWEVPGLSIAVVRNDTVLLARGYGVRALGEAGTVDEHTLFGIMSTTKAMTAAALAMLVDDGKVAWSDPVSKWLPELQFPDPFQTRELTVKDLLTHNTGLGNADLMAVRGDLDRGEILRRVRHLRPEYSLRSSFVYQNIMYVAAGEVVARASGMSYPEFLRTRIFAPLGMTRSYPTFSHGASGRAGSKERSASRRPTNTSWRTSSASALEPVIRYAVRKSPSPYRAYNSPSASSEPSLARRTSSRSSDCSLTNTCMVAIAVAGHL